MKVIIPYREKSDRCVNLNVKQMTLSAHTSTGSWSELAIDIAEKIDLCEHEEPVAFVYCTCPVFYKLNLVNDFLLRGKEAVESGKSAIVVESLRHYIVDENMKGVNFEQGEGHKYSQSILKWYSIPGVLTVTTPEDMLKHKYWYSPAPTPLEAVGPCLDIDTEEDFKIAKTIYATLSQDIL